MRRGIQRLFLRLISPAVIGGLILLGVSLAVVYSNRLYPMFFKSASYPDSAELLGYQVSLSSERSHELSKGAMLRLRDLKISYPLTYENGGCELKYGAVIYDHEGVGNLYAGDGQTLYTHMRYLIKFRYDLKNKRCESKDLYILSGDTPKTVTIQFINTALDSQKVSETPEARGIKISFERGALPRMNVEPVDIEPAPPFLRANSTTRHGVYSVPKVRDVSLLIHPYQPLNDFLIDELRRRIELCRTQHVCGQVLAAVAKISDREFLKLAAEAEELGMRVELITNHRYRLDQESDDFLSKGETVPYSPWLWVRGSPYSKYGLGKLQMHTKFVIFGDDMVVSSNPSIRAGLRNASREYSLIYRDPKVVKIFEEILTSIRTSLYYPVKVNLKDDLQVLFNANRPRHYAVSSEKPYLVTYTDEGVRSSAYGILHEILARNRGRMRVVMSPISNSCAPYRIDRCLFGILGERGLAGNLDLILNGYYYVPQELRSSPANSGRLVWDRESLKKSLDQSKAYNIFKDWSGAGSRIEVYMERLRGLSTHHERAALLGDDLSILGSANWGSVGTLNTIEVLRSKKLNQDLAREIDTFEEPWFVSERKDSRPSDSRHGGCEFMFEVSSRDGSARIQRTVPARVIIEELTAHYGREVPGPFKLVEPKLPLGPGKLAVTETELGESVNLRASYNCLQDPFGQNFVVRTPLQ